MLITQIKADQLQARKNRNAEVASVLTTLIGEADTKAKNAGQPLLDDASVIALIQKFVNGIKESLAIAHSDTLTIELETLVAYLPSMLSDEALQNAIAVEIELVTQAGTNPKALMGAVLKNLKAKFPGQYDGGKASQIVKDALAA